MRVLIIGSGVYGALVGAALIEQGGVDVTFLTRPSRQRKLITTGLIITSPFGRFRKPVQAIAPSRRLGDPLDAKGPFDVLIIAARAHSYQMGLFAVRGVIGPETLIVPLFDGVHHITDWHEMHHGRPVALAKFDVRASVDADGIVRQSGPPGDLMLGPLGASGAERIEPLLNALQGRRLCCHAADAAQIKAQVWVRAIFRAVSIGAELCPLIELQC